MVYTDNDAEILTHRMRDLDPVLRPVLVRAARPLAVIASSFSPDRDASAMAVAGPGSTGALRMRHRP